MVLNQQLYNELERIFGDVKVGNVGQQGKFTAPAPKSICFTPAKKRPMYVNLVHWGEVYSVNCPVCGDTRKRLTFSHLCGTKVFTKGRKTPYFVSRRACVCHNERCHETADLDKYLDQINWGDFAINIEDKIPTHVKFSDFLKKTIDLPKNSSSLAEPDLPEELREFCDKRRFNPEYLASTFNCRFSRQGDTYVVEDSTKETMDIDRIVAPIIQKRQLVSWQARRLVDQGFEASRPKYIYPAGTTKAMYLYNMDRAWAYKDVFICEGITDVWRIGKNAVSIFGKALSAPQLQIMETLWSTHGRAFIVLDPDAGKHASLAYYDIKKSKAFPDGVFLCLLDNADPADMTKQQIKDLAESYCEDEVLVEGMDV